MSKAQERWQANQHLIKQSLVERVLRNSVKGEPINQVPSILKPFLWRILQREWRRATDPTDNKGPVRSSQSQQWKGKIKLNHPTCKRGNSVGLHPHEESVLMKSKHMQQGSEHWTRNQNRNLKDMAENTDSHVTTSWLCCHSLQTVTNTAELIALC